MKTAAELRNSIRKDVAIGAHLHLAISKAEEDRALRDDITAFGVACYRKALTDAKAKQGIGFHGPIGFVPVTALDALDAVADEVQGK